MRFFRYLLVLIAPGLVGVSIHFGGWFSLAAPLAIFGIFPLFDLALPGSRYNLTPAEEEAVRGQRRYDLLLYSIVPLQYGLLLWFLTRVSSGQLGVLETLGMSLSMGMACGALGINAAHELGHRPGPFDQAMSKLLLLSTLYMHFFIEHNRGHHGKVATPQDPASARHGESLYRYLPRTLIGSWRDAWDLERRRLGKRKLSAFGPQNQMIRFVLIQSAFLCAILAAFGPIATGGFLVAAFVGALLLETVNYVEHYGLQRKKAANGRYERVQPFHSWNSNHPIGRTMLFEVSRHSDHHAHTARPYSVLRHFDDAAQLPTGYPGMMILAWFPPVWFAVMHPRIEELNRSLAREQQAA